MDTSSALFANYEREYAIKSTSVSNKLPALEGLAGGALLCSEVHWLRQSEGVAQRWEVKREEDADCTLLRQHRTHQPLLQHHPPTAISVTYTPSKPTPLAMKLHTHLGIQ